MVMRKFELNPDYLREGQGKADDRDLGTPQHDELMIRLLNKEVWKRLITEFGLLERSFSKSTLDYFKEKGEGLEITEIGAEVPVLRRFGGDQIIGYIDLAVKFGFEYSIEIIGCEIKATEHHSAPWSGKLTSTGSTPMSQLGLWSPHTRHGKYHWNPKI